MAFISALRISLLCEFEGALNELLGDCFLAVDVLASSDFGRKEGMSARGVLTAEGESSTCNCISEALENVTSSPFNSAVGFVSWEVIASSEAMGGTVASCEVVVYLSSMTPAKDSTLSGVSLFLVAFASIALAAEEGPVPSNELNAGSGCSSPAATTPAAELTLAWIGHLASTGDGAALISASLRDEPAAAAAKGISGGIGFVPELVLPTLSTVARVVLILQISGASSRTISNAPYYGLRDIKPI